MQYVDFCCLVHKSAVSLFVTSWITTFILVKFAHDLTQNCDIQIGFGMSALPLQCFLEES